LTTLAQITSDILLYTSYDDPDFVAEIPRFIQAAEERIFFFVQLPDFQRGVTGNFTASNPYLQLPADFLACASLAVIDPLTGAFTYLLPKETSYIREVYPVPASIGQPTAYALFSASAGDTTIFVGPTPDVAYNCELNYFYKPASLVTDTTGTWLSDNAYDTLLYGALSESANYLKKNAGVDNMGDTYEQRFLVGLQGLKNLGENRDRKDVYRNGEKRKPE
jgi:hypothetical protein